MATGERDEFSFPDSYFSFLAFLSFAKNGPLESGNREISASKIALPEVLRGSDFSLQYIFR